LPQPISAEAALCVYRVAQESFRNIAKHSGSSDAWVLLRANGPELMMQIKDGGAGFDSRTCHTSPGLGLSSMAERVNLVRGRLTITSKPGEGTLVDVRVPLSESVTA
jgi:signal transduction histidine kinase